MRFGKLTAGLALVLLIGAGTSFAGTDLNEVGAFLVYPLVVSPYPGIANVETFVTVTNAGADNITVHVSYVNGDYYDPTYCYECDFDIFLTGNDTETLVVTYGPTTTNIESMDGTVSRACPHPYGFITMNVEKNGEVVTDNVLLGEEVIVDYGRGMAVSIPAIPFQGQNGGNGDRVFDFDDQEYGKMPRVVAADFIAPEPLYTADSGYLMTADLALFTLGFERQFPPLVDCSITGFDSAENPFSRSVQFGCWTFVSLCDDLDPEFCYPNLGQFAFQEDEHGWLQLNCRVDPNGDSDGIQFVNGGVHGAITQVAYNRQLWGRSYESPYAVSGWAAWGRLLYQSVTTGDAVSLTLEGNPAGLD